MKVRDGIVRAHDREGCFSDYSPGDRVEHVEYRRASMVFRVSRATCKVLCVLERFRKRTFPAGFILMQFPKVSVNQEVIPSRLRRDDKTWDAIKKSLPADIITQEGAKRPPDEVTQMERPPLLKVVDRLLSCVSAMSFDQAVDRGIRLVFQSIFSWQRNNAGVCRHAVGYECMNILEYGME